VHYDMGNLTKIFPSAYSGCQGALSDQAYRSEAGRVAANRYLLKVVGRTNFISSFDLSHHVIRENKQATGPAQTVFSTA